MMNTPSSLEVRLKKIIRDHPQVELHPYSPNGPYVRAVMWTADPHLLGQAFWEPEIQLWVARAVYLPVGQDTQVDENPATIEDVPRSISRVISDLRLNWGGNHRN